MNHLLKLSLVISLIITTALNMNATTATSPDSTATADVKVLINTTEGPVTVLLYGDTPKHLKNFVHLASEGYYDGLLFHRVINDFMIQGGDPLSRDAKPGQVLGTGDPSYQIDAEILWPRHYHKRGALAAARQGDQVNPERRSSGSQFYIVTGRTFTDSQLNAMEQNMRHENVKNAFDSLARQHRDEIMTLRRARDKEGLQILQDTLIAQAEAIAANQPAKFTAEQRRDYTTIGGTPHLDHAYTVFGEVVDGMDVVDRIQKVETDGRDRPVSDVRILSVKIL